MFNLLPRAIAIRRRLDAVNNRLHVIGQNGFNAIVAHPQVRPPFTDATLANAIEEGNVFIIPMTVAIDAEDNVVCNLTPQQIATDAPLAIMLAVPTEMEPGRLVIVATEPEDFGNHPSNWIGPTGTHVFIQDRDPDNLLLIEAGAEVARIARDAHQGKILQVALPQPAHQIAMAAMAAVSATTREQQKLASATKHLHDTIDSYYTLWYPGHLGPEEGPIASFNMQAARNQVVQAQQLADSGRIDTATDRLSDAKTTALLTGRWGAGGISITDFVQPGRAKPSATPTVGEARDHIRYAAKLFTYLYGPVYADAVITFGNRIQDEVAPDDGTAYATIFDHFLNRARSPPSGVDPRRWMLDDLFRISRTDPSVMEFQHRQLKEKMAALQQQATLKAPHQQHERRGASYQSSHPYSQGAGRGGAGASGGRGSSPSAHGGGRAPSGRGHHGRGSPGRGGPPDTPMSLWRKKRPDWLAYSDKLICASVARNKACNNPSCPREHQYNPSYTADQRSEMAAWVIQHPNEV